MAWTERYVSVAGGGAHDGTSEADAWTLAEALAAYAGGQRINVKAGTYTAASRNWNLAGTASSGSWWRGYNTTIGDIDTDNTLTKPVIQAGANTQTFSGAHHLFTGLDFSGGVAGTLLSLTGAHVQMFRCRGENTDSGSTSYAVRCSANGQVVSWCWFKANVSSNFVGIIEEAALASHCSFHGGVTGLMMDPSTRGAFCVSCIFDDQAGNYAIDVLAGASMPFLIINPTCYKAGSHGIRVSATQPALGVIQGAILSENGGYGIGIASGGPVRIFRFGNDFYSNTSGTENGFGDWPSLQEITESSDPFEDAANDDFTPKSTANAINGAGGIFENL